MAQSERLTIKARLKQQASLARTEQPTVNALVPAGRTRLRQLLAPASEARTKGVRLFALVCVAVAWVFTWPLTVFGQGEEGTAAAEESLARGKGDFLAWARRSAMPLPDQGAKLSMAQWAQFGKIVGDANLVALSEALHGGAEPLEFRNQVFRYLVEKKGFTAIVLESGLVESRIVHDYVAGGSGQFATVMAEGFSWASGNLPQNHELVRWMRAYNEDPRHQRKIKFYGFDVPGSPSNHPVRDLGGGLSEALRYLQRVDAAAALQLQRRVEPLLPKLSLKLSEPAGPSDYRQLNQLQRDTLTATIGDVVDLFERHEDLYTRASSPSDYQWAYRAAIGARQTDQWARKLPLGTAIPDWESGFFGTATDVRDRAQADNFDWIVNQEGKTSKILLFMHRYHLSGAPVDVSWWPGQRNEVAGTFLRRRFSDALLTVGSLMAEGELTCTSPGCCLGPLMTVQRANNSSIDGMLSELGLRQFLLDLRGAPASIRAWLNRGQWLGQEPGNILKLPVAQAYDVLFYVDRVTPACKVNGVIEGPGE